MKYLANNVEEFNSCIDTSEPKYARKVSLSSTSREFNTVVCIDHLHLDKN